MYGCTDIKLYIHKKKEENNVLYHRGNDSVYV